MNIKIIIGCVYGYIYLIIFRYYTRTQGWRRTAFLNDFL